MTRAIRVKVLSVRQPWAWAIVAGHKDVENRGWQTAYRGWLLIHAGKQFDTQGAAGCLELAEKFRRPEQDGVYLNYVTTRAFGAIIGAARLVDCVTKSDSRWFGGPFGFVLAEPVRFAEPIPAKGRLGLFTPDPEILVECCRQMPADAFRQG